MKRYHLLMLICLVCGTCMVLLENGPTLRRKFRQLAAEKPSTESQLMRVNIRLDFPDAKFEHLAKAEPGKIANVSELLRKTIKASKWYTSEQLTDSAIRDAYGISFSQTAKKGTDQRMVFSQFNPLKLMPVMNPDLVNVTRVLLVTYFRSGSSFLGDLLQQNWKTFYTFEPLHYMSDGMRIKDDRADEALNVIENIFACEFPKISHYVRWALKPENRFLFKWNSFLWNVCRLRPSSCFNVAFIKEACIRASAQVMKVTRLHMRQVQKFVTTLTASFKDQLKVVYLVRDPRGIYSSRRGMAWCSNSTCASPATLCAEMSEDIEIFEQLKATDPDKYFIIRYEDMALTPRQESLELFHNLELPFTPSVSRFIRTHTSTSKSNRDSKNPYTTKRDSKSVAFDWRRTLKGAELAAVEVACSDVIQRLGYKVLPAKEGSENLGDNQHSGLLEEMPKELTGKGA